MAQNDGLDRLYATEWLSTEMNQDGQRVLIRARRITPDLYTGAVLPTVVTIEHQYETSRDDGLPDLDARREAYVELLLTVSNSIERERIGVHFHGDTVGGLIREWFYTNDVDRLVSIFRKHAPAGFPHDVFHEEDPSWSYADGLLGQLDIEAKD